MKLFAFVCMGIALLAGQASAQTNVILAQRMKSVERAANDKSCQFVKVRNELMDMYPAVLIDERPDASVSKIKLVVFPREGLLFFSVLLEKKNALKCQRIAFGIDHQTGELDFATYTGCPGSSSWDEPRKSDGYGFDPETKQRFGEQNKIFWQGEIEHILTEVERVAKKCLK